MARPTEAQLAPFLAAMEARDTISEVEIAAIYAAAGETKVFADQQDIVTEGDRPQQSTLVLSGIAARYSTVEDGGRQITGLHYAGDFVDLHSFPLKVMDHSVAAVGRCVVAFFPHRGLDRITETLPHLTRVLWLLTLIDGSIHRQWLVAKGRLSADEQLAHFFCEQYVRARIAGIVEDSAFAFPLTQQQLGDALGISLVHANRTLQQLRKSGYLSWENGIVRIFDWDGLRDYGQFEPDYLHLEKLPR